MDFKQAIEALKKLEGGADLVSAIEGEVTRLENKSFEVIGESRKNGTKARNYQEAIEAIGKALGIEGDVEAIVSNAEAKAKDLQSSLTSTQTKLTEVEGKLTTTESEANALKRQSKLTEVAAKSGADVKVLERLLAEKLEEMAIDESGVKLGDKALREFVEADESLKPFIPALFPATQQQQETKPVTPKLPSGSPDGGKSKKDLLDAYTQRNFGGIKALTQKTAVDS